METAAMSQAEVKPKSQIFYPRQLEKVEIASVYANIRQWGLTANEFHYL